MDCFIQYVARLRQSRTSCSSVQGHYIAFRHIEDSWYRFDDSVVHKVDLNRSYSVNLVIYRKHDMLPYICAASLAGVKTLSRSVPLNQKPKPKVSEDKTSSSSRPPLIMPDECTSLKRSSASGSLKLEVPTRSQPNRGNKSYIVYYGIGSDSSSDENIEDKTHSDSEYVQPKSRGKTMQCTFLLNISR